MPNERGSPASTDARVKRWRWSGEGWRKKESHWPISPRQRQIRARLADVCWPLSNDDRAEHGYRTWGVEGTLPSWKHCWGVQKQQSCQESFAVACLGLGFAGGPYRSSIAFKQHKHRVQATRTPRHVRQPMATLRSQTATTRVTQTLASSSTKGTDAHGDRRPPATRRLPAPKPHNQFESRGLQDVGTCRNIKLAMGGVLACRRRAATQT